MSLSLKLIPSDVYSTVASPLDTDTLHQQPQVNEEIHITDNTNFDKEPDEEPTVEHTTGLSEGNVEEVCLDSVETQVEETVEGCKKVELDMAATMENLSSPLCVKSQGHPELPAPTEPHEECFIAKAAECLDTDPQTAEVTENKPNEDDVISDHNTVESTDVVEYKTADFVMCKTDSSDVNCAVASPMDTGTLHRQPQVDEEIHITDNIDFDEEPDAEPTTTTDPTTTPPNGATETSPAFEDENSHTIGPAVEAKIPVSFGVRYFTHSPGQTLAVTGNHPGLGGWAGFLPLEETDDGYWTRTVHLPSMIQVEWKFVVVNEEGEVHPVGRSVIIETLRPEVMLKVACSYTSVGERSRAEER